MFEVAAHYLQCLLFILGCSLHFSKVPLGGKNKTIVTAHLVYPGFGRGFFIGMLLVVEGCPSFVISMRIFGYI